MAARSPVHCPIKMPEKKTKTPQVKKDAKSRNFCFTRNNYDDTFLEDRIACRYIIYGKEGKQKGKTPHLQGVVVFENPRSWDATRKIFHGASLEITRTLDFAIEYCKKEGDYTERGDRPLTQTERGKKGKEYWDKQLALIKAGRIDEVDSKLQITMPKNLDYIWNKEQSKRRKLPDTSQKHQWYWGETGTGKSRKARTDHPDAYLKMCNKWWDHYQEEDVVLIEDFDKNHKVLCHHLKLWSDRYPFLAEVKGGARKIRPGLIIVTSNFHPSDIWADTKDLNPILRRFQITQFHTGLKQATYKPKKAGPGMTKEERAEYFESIKNSN